MDKESYKPIEGLKEALNQPASHETQKAANDELKEAIEEELERQANRDEKLKKSGRLLPSNKKFNQMQRPGPNTMQPNDFTREL